MNLDMIGCIIQARIGSTRFPNKIMIPVDENDTVLSFGIKQVKSSKTIDKIIIATTDLPEDDLIVNNMKKLNIPYFRGKSKDVLDRYYQCAKKFNLSVIVRITSDCPLIDPFIIDDVVSYFLKNNEFDYVSNVHPIRTYPDGTDVEIFTFKVLEKAWNEAEKSSEREHVTPYIYNSKKFCLGGVKNSKDLSNLRWTVDHKEDLILIKEIVKRIHRRPILMSDILDLLSKFPELKEINKNIVTNEGYLKSLKQDEEFLKSKN
jgi:spore coat polysaccharide biosynthesis protein SpsF (cytidylyltransferase family)